MCDRYNEKKAVLPTCYVEYMENMETYHGWEGDLGDDLGWVVLWDKATIQDNWIDYEMSQCISNHWFPFGSNGGGEMLCFDLNSGTDRVFWIPYICMSDEDAMLLDFSFSDLAEAILAMSENHLA
jgi:SMI1 / KNR4 family (SUKH-1)